MEAILDSHADMASFFTSARKARCMNSGMRTPPSSPESTGSCKRAGPRLQLSKLLQKVDKHYPRISRRATNGATPPGCGKRTSKSPFRAVTEMKEPFPLMLPDSPALTDESSLDDENQRLRRIPASHLDLRALARIQASTTSNGNTPLLPSPMFEPCEDETGASSYFAYPNKREIPSSETQGDDAPYEVHRIISGYCTRERWSLLLEEVSQSKQASQLRHASSPWAHARQTAPTSPQPTTPDSQPRKRDRTCSTESDWLASNTSHEERYLRFKQRCCGMVQHPAHRNAPAHTEGEDEIMLATVLVGPGKPKLVQIQRPPSGISRSSQSRSSQADTATEEEESLPLTPLQVNKEVSSFSPYDTPCQRTYGAMTPMIQAVSSSDSVQRLRPAPLSITPRNTRYRIDSAVYVQDQKDRPLESPGPQCKLPSYTSSAVWPTPRHHTTRSHTSSSDTRLRNRKLAAALDQITSAIDAFPSTLLHLDSSLVRQLRNTPIASHFYVSPLQRIFPTASPLLLSALAAWCLVDAYLTVYANASSNGSASSEQQQQYHDICAASNESLHHIPAKARRMLGISSPESVSADAQERSLRARAQCVRVSVGVIAQRLMEAVKGGWVEELWRACGVIVQLVDAGAHRDGMEEINDEEEEWL